ncbi:MAG: CHAD domain-containing protein [Ignavibacterium sp.]|nr:CHAD domain-containing protein [Ignavibacterium sp.]
MTNRIESLLTCINIYFQDRSVESLHDVRIALRRVRYSMELFIVCYDKKIFTKFYNNVQLLQDLSGNVRDVDISLENYSSLVNEDKIKLNEEIILKANQKKIALEENFKLELMKFTLSKVLKDFLKQLT